MKEKQLKAAIDAALKLARELAGTGANVNDIVRSLRECSDRIASRIHQLEAAPLTRPSGTLSPSDGERDGVRGRAKATEAPAA